MFDIDKVLAEYGLTNETYEQFLNDCQKKVGKTLDVDWDEILTDYNIDWNPDTARKAQQPPLLGGAFIKQYYEEKSAKLSSTMNEDDYLKKLSDAKRELEKEKVKMRDERNELNKAIREQARKESFVDLVKRTISESIEPVDFKVHYTMYNSECDLLCHLTDIHTGIKIDSWRNKFDENVLKERIEKYTSDIIDIAGFHQTQNCYLVIGEIISGLIHSNLRLENNMNIIEQFKYVSELISAMICRLANHFENVNVFVTPGNHSRVVAKKEDSLDGENMDLLLPFYLKAKLQNVENVHIMDNEVDPEIAMFIIRGNVIMSSHGHKDSVQNVVQNFTMLFGIKPSIVLLGHRHTNSLTTVYDTKVIESGCVSGTDSYAASKRLSNRPEQTVSVIDENGLKCIYDIQLD